MSLVELELFTLLRHLSSPRGFEWGPVFSFICMFCRSLFFLLFYFYFGHCVVYPSSIYGFLLPLWYPQTLLYTPTLIWSVPNTKVDPKELRVWQVSLCYFYPLGYNKLHVNNYIFRFSFHDNKTRNSYTILQFPLDKLKSLCFLNNSLSGLC